MAIIIERNYGVCNSGIQPVVYVSPPEEILTEAISISIPLAVSLSRFSSIKMRSIKMETVLIDVLMGIPEKSVIKDFDVLFNPSYKVDVIAVLKNACKKREFKVVWPGIYKDGCLYYAEHGFSDYKVFNLDNYDIICVI